MICLVAVTGSYSKYSNFLINMAKSFCGKKQEKVQVVYMTYYSTRQIFYYKHYLEKIEYMCFTNIFFKDLILLQRHIFLKQ